MRIHSDAKIQSIKNLREKGYSINEIVNELGVPRTTVWHHIQKVKVAPEFSKILASKRGGSAIRSAKAWKEAENRAKQILAGEHSKLAIAAAMLYWGEGGKKSCDITNTDPNLLQLYLNFLYNVLGVDKSEIKFTLRIFTGMKPAECLKYWSDAIKVDEGTFIIRYNDGGMSGKAKYGMCRIVLKKGSKYLKLMLSLIRFSFSLLMGYDNPIPQWINYRRMQIGP